MVLTADRVNDCVVIVAPVEELDAVSAGEFLAAIRPTIETDETVVIDMSRLRFVDSSGVGAFLSCLRKLTAQGGHLRLCAMRPAVRGIFQILCLDRLFDISETCEEAVAKGRASKRS